MQDVSLLCLPKTGVGGDELCGRFKVELVGLRGDVTSRNDMIVRSTDEDVARKLSFRNDAQDIRVASVRNVNGNR